MLRRRSEYVLALAAAFAHHLAGGAWAGRFERVVFSVLDTSPAQGTFAAFRRAVPSDARPATNREDTER